MIIESEPNYEGELWKNCSKEARDFVRSKELEMSDRNISEGSKEEIRIERDTKTSLDIERIKGYRRD